MTSVSPSSAGPVRSSPASPASANPASANPASASPASASPASVSSGAAAPGAAASGQGGFPPAGAEAVLSTALRRALLRRAGGGPGSALPAAADLPEWSGAAVPDADLVGALALARAGRVVPQLIAGFDGPRTRAQQDLLDREEAAAKVRAMQRNGAILAAAPRIFAVLDRAGVRAVCFKGPAQQQQLYGDPFQRASGDLDLLVPRRDRQAALGALARAGFRQLRPGSLWWDRFLREAHLEVPGADWSLDLHHGLQQPGLPQPRNARSFLDGAERVETGRVVLPAVSRAQVPLVVAMNLVKAILQRGRSLDHAFDLATALGGGADPDRVTAFEESARAVRLGATADLAIRVTGALFDIPLVAEEAPPRRSLAGVSPACLRRIALAPAWADVWPRRRSVMRAACGGALGDFIPVSLWYAGSEAVRVFDRRA